MASQYGTMQHQPAVLDSCLHLGASAPSPADSMRVPAGFAALSLPASHDALAWGSAGAFSSAADGSALSSYRLAGGVVRLAVQDLLARPLAPATAAVPASSMAQAAQSLQYVLQAPVCSPAERAGSRAWPAAIVWQEISPGQLPRSTQLLRRSSARLLPSQAVRASLMTLAKLQTTISSGPSSQQQLLTSHLPSSCVEGEAAAAMLRTAAQEQPGISWEVVGNDAHSRYVTWCAMLAARVVVEAMSMQANPGHANAVAVAGLAQISHQSTMCRGAPSGDCTGDAYGMSATAGVICQPQLLPQHAQHPHTQAPTAAEATLITGGLGSIGRLSAAWLACQTIAPFHITLISRSGHTAADPAWAIRSQAQITCQRADISAAAEAAWCLQSLGQLQPQLAVFHAGGSLADATIAVQTAAGLRAGFAPKLGGLAALEARKGHLRQGPSVMVSSTAALLGPAGQAGYAAANAAMNAQAQSWAREGDHGWLHRQACMKQAISHSAGGALHCTK